MKRAQEAENAIRARFGDCASFALLCRHYPDVASSLWNETRRTYLDNPLPARFKERAFIYVARFCCDAPYCAARHMAFVVAALRDRRAAATGAVSAHEAGRLLTRPFPAPERLRAAARRLGNAGPLERLPEPNSLLEWDLLFLSAALFQQPDAGEIRRALECALGEERSAWLAVLLSYIRQTHRAAQTHPELQFEGDLRRVLREEQEGSQWLGETGLKAPRRWDVEAAPDPGRARLLERENKALADAVEQHKLREGLLRQREKLFLLASEGGQVGIFDIDFAHGAHFWSPQFKQLYGLRDGDSVTALKLIKRVHPGDRRRVLRLLRRSRSPQWSGRLEIEHRVTLPDGAERWLLLRARAHFDPEQRVARQIGAVTDITHKRLTESALRESEGRLLQGNAELEQRVRQRTQQLEQQAQQLRILARQLTEAEQRERRRLAELLHDHLQQLLVAAKMSLDFGRKDVGDPRAMERNLAGALDLLQQAIEASRNLTAELRPPILYESGLIPALRMLADRLEQRHGLRIAVVCAEDAEPRSDAVRGMLYSSAHELLFNAVKHARTSAIRLRLGTRADGGIRLQVRDSGCGFDPAIVEARPLDSGFGLFSLRERVRAMGGRLWINSRAGRGSAVHIVVPPEAAAAPEDAAAPERTASRNGKPRSRRGKTLRILLADDHSIVREGIATLLLNESDLLVVGHAEDGRAALEQARRLSPDVVIMDLNMPRMNGIEATRAIKSEFPNIDVIGLSVETQGNAAAAMKDAGATAYLSKSDDLRLLIATLQGLAAPRRREPIAAR